MKYVYGPVPSRRLGRSLGVNVIPSKTCNYSCIYCQLGRTDRMTNERRNFFPPEDIFLEIEKSVIENNEDIDYVTFVGEGEPTLCSSLGYLIDKTKALSVPVAVITNGSLFYRQDVREELKNVDVVLPSLDVANEEKFIKVNRPHKEVKFNEMVNGLIEFSKIRKGQLWIEVMLVKGVNDTEEELEGIAKILEKVNPDRVYVNVPIRPPAEKWVEIPNDETLIKAHEILKSYVVSGYETNDFHLGNGSVYEEIIQIAARHPLREEQLKNLAQRFSFSLKEILDKLEKDPHVKIIEYRGKRFFLVKKIRAQKGLFSSSKS